MQKNCSLLSVLIAKKLFLLSVLIAKELLPAFGFDCKRTASCLRF